MRNLILITLFMCLGVFQPLAAQDYIPAGARPTVVVSGTGKVAAVPDRAKIFMSVSEMRPRATEAKDIVDKRAGEVQEALIRMGVEKIDINATGLQIHRITEHEKPQDKDRPQVKQEAFRVTRQLIVDVMDIGKLDEILDRAVSLGINEIGHVSLYSSREDALHLEALRLAAADARQKAEVLAGAFDRRLKKMFMAAHEYEGGGRPYTIMMESGRGRADFSQGTIDVSARVEVVFEIE